MSSTDAIIKRVFELNWKRAVIFRGKFHQKSVVGEWQDDVLLKA